MRYHHSLADLVVFIHALFIGFVVFGLLLILIGAGYRWRWIRNFWFRMLHLLAIGIVVIQALLGITCPLTTLESNLRLKAGETPYTGSFIGHWLNRLIFFEGPPWVFAVCYCLFGAAVLATFIFIRPNRWRHENRDQDSPVRNN